MIAVTTHSRTRGFRYALPMLRAGRRIERQLGDAPGCERYANVIAGPREFWTLTIWRDVFALRKCMREGAHSRVMWHQPYWLDCYWGMRWRPAGDRHGRWPGEPLEWPDAGSTESVPSHVPEALHEMPSWMQSALGSAVHLERRQLAGAVGATYRLRVPPWRIPSAVRDLRRLRRLAASDRDAFRLSLGLGTGGALYLLVVATSQDALQRLRATPEHSQFLQRWGDRAWWSTWEPESEFGNWESHRLRDGLLAGERLLADAALPAKPIAAHQARQTLRSRLQALDSATLEVLQLLTSELVANSARHAGLVSGDRIGLQVRGKSDWIRVEVIDRGRQFEPHVPLSKSSADGSGWGLFVVNQTAERWGIIERPPNRHVWFELRVPVLERRSEDPSRSYHMSTAAPPN
jgi:anti-sigma regulatory factor (Ser/Thr protein kinase)